MNNEQYYYFVERTYAIQDKLFDDIERLLPEKDQESVKKEVIKLIQDAKERVLFGVYHALRELESLTIEVPQEEKEK